MDDQQCQCTQTLQDKLGGGDEYLNLGSGFGKTQNYHFLFQFL